MDKEELNEEKLQPIESENRRVTRYVDACQLIFEGDHTPFDFQRALFKHSAGMELNEDEGELLADLNAFLSMLCS